MPDKRLSTLTTVLLLTAITAFAAPDFDPLSKKWATYITAHPGSREIAKNRALAKFKKLHERGIPTL